ncbi:LPXTG cell wall anchor domain-containing protein [Pontibacillus yanchengensis]|nr:LPXTG cell wall anchor domain-containing protein [Pontibacillus yanchengensis]
MKRNWIALLLAFSLVAILTGCADGTAHVYVNKDGSMDVNVDFVLPQQAQMVINKNMENRMKDAFQEQGFSFEKQSSDEGLHYHAEQSLTAEELQNQIKSENDFISLEEKNQFFTTTYIVDGEVNVAKSYETMLEDIDNSLPIDVMNTVLNQFDLQFKLTLPMDVIEEHNATKKDGNTLTWDISLTEATPIYFKASVPNIKNIAIVGVGLLLIIGIAIWWGRRRKKQM